MTTTFPFLTSYDPPGTSEGTLDPLGLFQIADQLGEQLVPAVRERMQRIRFLTAMAVGAFVTEGLGDEFLQRDASPYLVWEWLVVEALVRERDYIPESRGLPGALVTRRAISQYGYLDSRSYLKTPRIFGFNGVYKRLAIHLGILDVHLAPGPNAARLVDAWTQGLGFTGFNEAKRLISRWRAAVQKSLHEKPPRTKPGWGKNEWMELAQAFAPVTIKGREKRYLRDLLLSSDERQLGALPSIWQLQNSFDDNTFSEESLHHRLEEQVPGYRPILEAIRTYESFARSLQDAFDVFKAEAATLDARGFTVRKIAHDADFCHSVDGLNKRFEEAYRALGDVTTRRASLQTLFMERFRPFAESMDPGTCALILCDHHKAVQRAKSADGKRPWFVLNGEGRIYIRQQYRETRREIQPDRYVHNYRGWPIRRFYMDLS